MSGPETSSTRRREPLLYGVIGGLVVLVLALAVVLVMALGGPGQVPVAASSAPTIGPSATPAASAEPSMSAVPNETTAPTLAATLAPNAPTTVPIGGPTPPPATAKPTPTPNTNPRIVSFTVPATEDCTDDTAGSIQVSWTIARATGVTISIDGPGIYDSYPGTSNTITLPYGCSTEVSSHTYTLRTTGGSGPAATLTKTVKTAAPRVDTFHLPASAGCLSSSGSVAIALEFAVSAATGAALYRDGEIYANYNGTSSTNGLTVPYDCTKGSSLFRLVTIGGYGSADEATVTVTDGLP